MDLPPITLQAVLLGLGILVGGWLVGRLVGAAVRWVLVRRGRGKGSSRVFGGLVSTGIMVFAIAAGIAFQTVLGNMFAGMVILARDSFREGEQIQVGEHAGNVVHMGLSATAVKTFDGRLVLLPSQMLHSQAVTVQTGFSAVRSSVRVDVEAGQDLDRVHRIAQEAMASVPQVLTDPAPQAILAEVGVTTVGMDLRFWSGARQMETKETMDAVIEAVLTAFTRQGVGTGDDVRVVDAGPQVLRLLEERMPRV